MPRDLLPDWLTTERLALRRFTPDDVEWFVRFYADPEVTQYLGGPRGRDNATELLHNRVLKYYDEHPGLGIWMTRERATGEPVGFHLINHIQGETLIQVGYALVKSAWGKGYATEMAAAVLHYGFVDLQIPLIVGITNLPNVASQRVLEKIGLERKADRLFPHPAYASQGPMAYFEAEATAWLPRFRAPAGPHRHP